MGDREDACNKIQREKGCTFIAPFNAKIKKPKTLADGLQAKMGNLTWAIVRDLVDDVVVVEEEEIVESMKLVYERMKVVVEPSGAVGVAATIKMGNQLAQRYPKDTFKKIGVVLCGGNTDFSAVDFW